MLGRTLNLGMRALWLIFGLCAAPTLTASPTADPQRALPERTERIERTSTLVTQSRRIVAPGDTAASGRLVKARLSQLAPAAALNLARLIARLPPAAELKIWNGRDRPPSEFFQLVPGPITADRNRANLNWYFRFATDLKPASAIYQVSLFPFSSESKDPLNAPGLVAQGPIGNVPTNGGQALFTIDFAPIVRGRPWAKLNLRPLATSALQSQPESASARTASPAQLRPELRRPPAATAQQPANPGLIRAPNVKLPPTVDPVLAQLSVRPPTLHTGYFIRVVLKKAGGGVLGSPSNPVHISFENLPPPEEIELVMGSHPPVHFSAYRPVQPDDWAQMCFREYVGPRIDGVWGPLLVPGAVVDICAEDDDSFFEDLADAISDIFNALGNLVDSVGAIYQWAKAQAVALAASALEGLGLPCPCPIGSCEVCLSAALDYGLMSLGIPPTLPSFDELVNQGVDYLAVTIAAETGMPVSEALDVARELAEASASDSAPGVSAVAWQPLPQHLYAPLLLKLRVGAGKWPVNLIVEDPSGRYQRATVPVPALQQEIVIPIALMPTEPADGWRGKLPTAQSLPPPSFAGLGDWAKTWGEQMNAAYAALGAWRQRYTNDTVQLDISSLSAIGSGWTQKKHLTLRCAPTASQCAMSQ